MTIDLEPSPTATSVAARTEAFVEEVLLPVEPEIGDLHDAPESVRRELQDAARAAGVFAPHASERWGGLGLDRRDQVPVFMAAGRSLLGPLALNIAAPDEGNVHLLNEVAAEEQQLQYLEPLARGEIRSAFAMTEPAPGAGSDPSLLRTSAERAPGGWRIDGRKWFTTGAIGASFFICMARTSGTPGDRGGATMFLVDADTPGLTVEREIPTMDRAMFGGHAELRFEHCLVPDASVLGAVDQGFALAQVRLAPARLTHCMRWLGIARRAQELAIARAADRSAFGARLAELGMIQQMVADSEIDLAASEALVVDSAWRLDRGDDARDATSVTKIFVSEAVGRVVDRAVQICGAYGISHDTPLARFYQEVRPFRIYDGPSETHRWAIAKRALRGAGR